MLHVVKHQVIFYGGQVSLVVKCPIVQIMIGGQMPYGQMSIVVKCQ